MRPFLVPETKKPIYSGYHKQSVAYFSNGTRRFNQPFSATPYGPAYQQGDVIGVGYRPRTGTIFFTRNGRKLEDVVHGLKSPNFFPAVGAIGPCVVHVNFGQAGFVFIEANVKKWGLAPMTGSLAPPPPYGAEEDTILLETGTKDGFNSGPYRGHHYSQSAQPYRPGTNQLDPGHSRSRSGNFRVLPPVSPGPPRSPTDISLAHLVPTDDSAEASSSTAALVRPYGPADIPNDPPPEYTSPDHSDTEDNGSRRSGGRGETAPLLSRSRGNSLAGSRVAPSTSRAPPSPPIPSYQDAIRQGAGHDRSDSVRSERADSR